MTSRFMKKHDNRVIRQKWKDITIRAVPLPRTVVWRMFMDESEAKTQGHSRQGNHQTEGHQGVADGRPKSPNKFAKQPAPGLQVRSEACKPIDL